MLHRHAMEELVIEVNVNTVTDYVDIMAYNVLSKPGLVISTAIKLCLVDI
jgi:hypothetical protein